MFSALKRYGLYYDSSMSTSSPSWPYTLEYRMPHSCAVHPCPSSSHPGMWEIPMPTLKDVRGGSCAMADGCYYEEDKKSIQKIFTENFLDRYTKDKTPFPCFSIQLGSSTDLTVPKPFSLSSIQFSLYPMFILLPAKN